MRSLSPARGGRLLLALAAALAANGALAQAKTPAPAPTPAATPAATATAPAPGAQAAPADDATREAIRREVEKAKQEIRDEVRAELQGQQAAKDFLQGADAEDRKLQFLELHGYLRFRSDLFKSLDLSRGADPGGYYLFPRPITNPTTGSTLTNVNTRLRLEPTLNVSEQIRVYSQVDVLDNYALGSTPDTLSYSTDLIPLGTRAQRPGADSIRVKRAWAEVQTPVGVLAFGRQRAEWGLGILDHAGEALDDDLGSTVDRIQFAIPLRSTPIGALTVVPLYDLLATGPVAARPLTGQPIDADKSDDATALGVKIAHVDTDEERRLKLDQGLSSWGYGLYYTYRQQGYAVAPDVTDPTGTNTVTVRRNATAHVFDLWTRWQKRAFRLELEGTGIIGSIENGSNDPANPSGQILIRQFGAVAQAAYTPTSRWTLGTELGVASGDRAPGMGNQPGRGYGQPGSIDGAQFGGADRDFRNFRFNPAYRVDLLLWREILGGVTDAWYLRPNVKYSLIDGLDLTAALIYSQAIYRESTPSTLHKPLGVEADFGIHYRSDDGFHAWIDYGLLQPLDGFNGAADVSRAQAIRTGLAVKF